ncbi:MAG: site-2 protease family protein [Chloroflexi bacterium]|nr:MAG: site-2 protease family protein [Chloroflexota bacterium]TMF46893.1 MAG: site-2 protease family protein [Chloroflexota bacterium]
MINVILAFMIIGSFLVAVIIHEYGHALVATMLGDPTPRAEGRLSLSLRSHIDPLGTLLCVILAFFQVAAGPVGLGWGRPVKSDPWKLRGGPNGGTLLVALGGIIMNVIVGIIFSVLLRVLPVSLYSDAITIRIPQLITVFASVNFCLAIFNLIPLHPLDGYQIVYTLLPSRQAVSFARSAPYGQFIILLLIFLLPFLGQISGLGDFFLFHISYYILLGSMKLMSLASGFNDGALLLLYIA